jgi:predicted TIM-barrel fold metal-dependent hydrolase
VNVLDGARVLDADGHVVEPPELFRPWAPAGRPLIDLPSTTPMIPCGDSAVVADQLEHGFDAPSYLRAMDAQGIDAAVLYPSIGLFAPFQPELAAGESADACRAYNEWIASFCTTDRGRLFGIALVPLADVSLAAAVAAEAAGLGLTGVMVRPNHLYERTLGDPALDPLYATVVDRGLTLSVHEGLGVRGPTIGSDRFAGFATRHACSHPMEQMAAMTSLVLEGALERHPSMHVAFLESGTGWLPYWLARLDAHREWLRDTECAALSLSASEYFARQCVISSEADDDLVGIAVAHVGADHVMWASDFPHPDAVFPGAAAAFVNEATGQGLARADVDTILWDTPARFYGINP